MTTLVNPGKCISNIGVIKKSPNITLLRQAGLGVKKITTSSMKTSKVGIANFNTGSHGASGAGFYWK